LLTWLCRVVLRCNADLRLSWLRDRRRYATQLRCLQSQRRNAVQRRDAVRRGGSFARTDRFSAFFAENQYAPKPNAF
jgi:hypothetical protein